MGNIFLAHDNQLDRKVVIKILSFSPGDKEAASRFLHEARASAMLNHPNIITVYDSGEVDLVLYIAMEYLEGKSLREILDTGTVSVSDAVHFALQTAQGLHFAHQTGIIHGDLKPENLMVDSSGKI